MLARIDGKMDQKYIILVGDGMGDYPLEELGGRTPLMASRTSNLDRLVLKGRLGLVRTIPEGMEPGSDVANMSLLGYDPRQYHTGRGPLEAASMGLQLARDEVAFRCNLVNLETDSSGATRMGDYSAGHISTNESHRIVTSLQSALQGTSLRLYPGVGYRHLLIWPGGREDIKTTPPHDITGRLIAPYRQVYFEEPVLLSLIEKAAAILANHPVNRERLASGKRPANAVWPWGQGRAPSMPTLKEKFGLTGAMISAVDLLKGLGVYAGLGAVSVPGATGYLDTNYAGKVNAALDALETGDLVFVHIEAPDEASHEGNLERKLQAIEDFDEKVLGPLVMGAGKFSKVRLMVVTDHLTPIKVRTHVADLVPFLLVEDLHASGSVHSPAARFCEDNAKQTGWQLSGGPELFNMFVGLKS
jgi:2,3-bisphosphoglycerate-independent phosphoglycerate mutase